MFRSSFIEDLNVEILKIYEQIERKARLFKQRTGISCLDNCGECCSKGRVRMTPLEFIPLALELCRRRELHKYIQLVTEGEDDLCVFYRPLATDMRSGSCAFYEYRAATCRLYGFGFKRDKYGQLEPVMCEYLKERFLRSPHARASASLLLDYDPIMIRLVSLSPSLGIHRYPPNRALSVALEKVGLLAFLNSAHYRNEDCTQDIKYCQSEKEDIKMAS